LAANFIETGKVCWGSGGQKNSGERMSETQTLLLPLFEFNRQSPFSPIDYTLSLLARDLDVFYVTKKGERLILVFTGLFASFEDDCYYRIRNDYGYCCDYDVVFSRYARLWFRCW
jgi:hypothetical protein